MRLTLRLMARAALILCAPSVPPALADVGPCGVAFSKVDYDQLGADDGRLELVELRAAPTSTGKTLGECGVARLVPWDGDACAREAASRSIELGDVVIPASGRVVLTRAGAAAAADATAATKSGSWLENGPDLLVLEGTDGPLLALAYGEPRACAPAAVVVAAGVDAEATSGPEHWLVECDDGWRRLVRDDAEVGHATACPPVVASAGGGGASGGHAGAPSTGGAATCGARITKVDVTQPGGDRAEAVELEVSGEPPPAAHLRDCGVERVAWVNANTEREGCGPRAGTYLERVVGGLTIPVSRRLVIGNREGADLPLSEPSASDVVQPGPDYVTLVGADGSLLDAVMYASTSGAIASCDLAASRAPADPDARSNRVLVRCDGEPERWLAAPEAAIAWRAAVACPLAGWPDDSEPTPPVERAAASTTAPSPSASAATTPRRREGLVTEDPTAAGCSTSSGGGVPAVSVAIVAAWFTRRRLRARDRRAPGRSRRAP